MNQFQQYIPSFSQPWKEKYHAILVEEHLESLSENILKFKNQTLDWDLPFFNEEIKIDRKESFNKFISILKMLILMRLKQNNWKKFLLNIG